MKPLSITPKSTLTAIALGLFLPLAAHAAAIDYGTVGASYTQDFDSFGSTSGAWTNGTTITGWHWVNSTGALSTNYNPQDGDSNSSVLLALGTDGTSERAFGAQNGNAIQTLFYGSQILNSTGGTLNSFALSYIGEQWRVVTKEDRDQLIFEYQIFDAGVTDPLLVSTGWTNVAELDFNAPQVTTGSSGKLDGNHVDNRLSISSTVNGLTWANGQELWLRWSDINPVENVAAANGSRRAEMGIDDINFSATAVAIPEPGTYGLLFGALTLGFVAQRRRRLS